MLRGKFISENINRKGKNLKINNGGLYLKKIKKSKLNLKEAGESIFRAEIDEMETRNSIEKNQSNKI